MGNIVVGCPKGYDLRRGPNKIQGFDLLAPDANLNNVKCIVTCPSNKGYNFVSDGSNYSCVKNGHSVKLNPQEPIFYEKSMGIDAFLDKIRREGEGGRGPVTLPHDTELKRVNDETNKGDTSVQELLQKLKPFRPPTAPDSDIERERKAILKESGMSLVAVQVALFSFLLSMLIYLFLPSSYSHILVFLILSVAIALVFFLKK